MNAKLKLVRFVLAVTLGSLLWAGCTSPNSDRGYSATDNNPPDLTKRRADTHPERRTGLHDQRNIWKLPGDSTIDEAAGAERLY